MVQISREAEIGLAEALAYAGALRVGCDVPVAEFVGASAAQSVAFDYDEVDLLIGAMKRRIANGDNNLI